MEILDASNTGNQMTRLSSLYHYYKARVIASQAGLTPLTFQNAFDAVAQFGVSSESHHNYVISATNAAVAPSPDADQDANQFRIALDSFFQLQCQQLRTIPLTPTWREFLLRRIPLILGFWITREYDNLRSNDPTHGIPTTHTTELHAVTVMGFDDAKDTAFGKGAGAFQIKDSRGPGFGVNGHWWLPYQLVETDLVFESWSIEGITY